MCIRDRPQPRRRRAARSSPECQRAPRARRSAAGPGDAEGAYLSPAGLFEAACFAVSAAAAVVFSDGFFLAAEAGLAAPGFGFAAEVGFAAAGFALPGVGFAVVVGACLLYTSPSPRDRS